MNNSDSNLSELNANWLKENVKFEKATVECEYATYDKTSSLYGCTVNNSDKTYCYTGDTAVECNKDKLSNLYTTLNKEIMNILNNNKNRVDTIKVKLDLLNPDNVLDKGYSIIYKDNKIVKDINSINTNDSINIMVKNGNIDAIVKGVKNGKERK